MLIRPRPAPSVCMRSSRSRSGSPKKLVGALVLERQEVPLDGPDAGRRDPAVFRLELVGVVAGVLGQGPEVLEVEEVEPGVVGDAEDDGQDPALDVVEVEEAREEERPHVRHGRPHGVALLAEDVPEGHRAAFEGVIAELQLGDALLDLRVGRARLADPGQVALDVGHEDGHADAAEVLGHDLEGDRLARSRRAGHEAVAVGHLREKEQVLLALLRSACLRAAIGPSSVRFRPDSTSSGSRGTGR